MTYKSIPILLPQNTSQAQMLAIRQSEYNNRRTITQSHDEAIQLVRLGNNESYIIIYELSQWPHDIQTLLLNYPYQLRTFHNTPNVQLHYRPCDSNIITQKFGANPEYYKRFGFPGHEGIDYLVAQDYPFYAAQNGVVVHASNLRWQNDSLSGYGWHVVIDHGSFYTAYCHAKSQLPVYKGQDVHAGDIVGYSGNTGNSTGYHLHFMVLSKVDTGNLYPMTRFGQPIDPEPFLIGLNPPPPPTPQTGIDILSYMKSDPNVWTVVRHPSGNQEDFRVYVYPDNKTWVMVKNNLGEWWEYDNTYISLVKDTSPDNASDGTERLYKVNPGRWIKRYMSVGENFNDGGHYVQFYRKSDCHPHPENSGESANNALLLQHQNNFTLNQYGQNITLDDVIIVKSGVETHIFARHQNKPFGRVAWYSPWGKSEMVAYYLDRGVLTNPPDEYC